MKKTWRKIHRWIGLLLVGFTLFYCLTGILLNHRKAFSYFQTKTKQVSSIEIQDQTLLHDFINRYKAQINQEDNPKVIRIKGNGVIEFLYGSHGRTTYAIDPAKGTMTRIDKIDQQPWHWLNRLHKAYKTNTFWLITTDSIALLLITLTLSGVLLMRSTRQDILLLVAGFCLLVLSIGVG